VASPAGAGDDDAGNCGWRRRTQVTLAGAGGHRSRRTPTIVAGGRRPNAHDVGPRTSATVDGERGDADAGDGAMEMPARGRSGGGDGADLTETI